MEYFLLRLESAVLMKNVNVDQPGTITLSKISLTQKDKYCMRFLEQKIHRDRKPEQKLSEAEGRKEK